MTHVIVLMLVFCGASVSAATEEPYSTNEFSENNTNAVHWFSENITNAVPFYEPFPVSQQDIDNLRQQLNQESLIRLSLTNQMYSLLNDVIAMKKQMGQMDSIMQELAHYKNSSLGNNNNKNVYLFSHWDNYNYSLIIPILVPILKI